MPRFYFNIHDGTSIIDDEGIELPNSEAARLEGIRVAGEILRGEADRIALGEDWRIEVTDHTGLILFQRFSKSSRRPLCDTPQGVRRTTLAEPWPLQSPVRSPGRRTITVRPARAHPDRIRGG